MATATQIRSAIMLRHHGRGHAPAEVLTQAAAAVERMERQGRVSPGEARRLRRRIAEARERDAVSGKGG